MHLTSRCYLLVVVTAALAISVLWAPTPWSEGWRVMAIATIVLLVYERLWVARHGPEISRAARVNAHLGRDFDLELVVNNVTPRAMEVAAIQALPASIEGPHRALNFNLEAGDTASAAVRVRPKRLGAQHCETIHTRVRGCFGLAWWSRQVQQPTVVEVLPDLLGRAGHRTATAPHGTRAARRAGSGLELLGLRDYTPGDSLRTVDWKATARSGRPMVRVFAEDQRLEILMMLDCSRRSALGADKLDRLGHAVNVAARLAEQATLNGDRVGLLCFAGRVLSQQAPGRGRANLVRIRRTLGECRSHTTEPALLPAAVAARALLARRALVVVFTELDVEDRGGQWLRALGLLTPKHLPLIASQRDAALEALALARPSSWREVFDGLAAGQLLETAEANIEHARRLGARVVAVPPAALDQAVLESYAEMRSRRRV